MPRADRLFVLARLLSGPSRRTLDELVRELRTSPRTIYRDLADLEARGIAIERVDGRYRFLQSSAVHSLPLSGRERILLTIALENPLLEHQPAWRPALRQLRSKLASSVPSDEPFAALAGPDRSGAVPDGIMDSIEGAIRESHSISFRYTSLSSGKTEWRGVDPWMLIHRSEAWYLIGRCHVHDDPRMFRLDRVRAVLPIGTSFERPAEFDPARMFEHSWGVYSSREIHDIRIVFDASVAPLIEHAFHHSGEEKLRLEDGRIEYRVRIGALEEIARWIAGFGGKAVAIAPEELIESVRTIAGGAGEAHAERGAKRAAAKVVRVSRRRERA